MTDYYAAAANILLFCVVIALWNIVIALRDLVDVLKEKKQ